MPPASLPSSSYSQIRYLWDDEHVASDGSGKKKRDNKNYHNTNNNDDKSDKGTNSNKGGENNYIDNNNYAGGGDNFSQESSASRTTSSTSTTQTTITSSVERNLTQATLSTATSKRTTSSSFIPTSTFSNSMSFDIPTSAPSLPSSNSIPISTIPDIDNTSANGALGVTTGPGNIHRVFPLGSIVAIILGLLFCITIALVIYVITRPRFGSPGRLWKKSTIMTPTIGSFEPKEHAYGHSDMYGPEDYSRSISRSDLLDNFQFPAASSQEALGRVAHSSGIVKPSSTPTAPAQIPDGYPSPSYVVPSPSSAPAKRLSSSGADVPREPSRNYRSMTRMISMLEGYPFEHEERGPGSDNALNYPRSVHETV